ncbi:peptidoglycan DD-metalloendopeptidase family protein [Thermoactinomyces sp. CICC 10521]|uniref:peptidoglycan DD-metalloendopeptidase family protein n=1 Tax=Thermoactinomyces sp. CICC 10521 TaxID=2767426 RepID=UPI0018DC3AD8|nr:peptidoglycan DD-metalloendopeptidase family protein [Thermoactinomyces sp. CICC 10521]
METSTESAVLTERIYGAVHDRISSKVKWVILSAAAVFAVMFFFAVTVFGTIFTSLFISQNRASSADPYAQWEVSQGFPQAAKKYLPIYQAAGKKYGVPWQILAAIHKVETDFGRNLSTSPVGARGQMQFMDKTWLGWRYPGGSKLGDLPDSVNLTDPRLIQKYGGYGVDANGDGKADPYNPEDAIYATAKYLAANHQPGEDWFARGGAVWQYNHDYENYVLKVKSYAEQFAHPVVTGAGSGLATGQLAWPVSGGRITSTFGTRFDPVKKVVQLHKGIDIGAPLGTPILASDGGVVIESRVSSGYGWIIVIDHGNGWQTLYAHMYPEHVKVQVGQKVGKGQVIAEVGSNGWSTGPHLHFEVHKNGQLIDPQLLLRR